MNPNTWYALPLGVLLARQFLSIDAWGANKVGRCRLKISKPVTKAPMVSTLEAGIC
jgi:hypothetical protein